MTFQEGRHWMWMVLSHRTVHPSEISPSVAQRLIAISYIFLWEKRDKQRVGRSFGKRCWRERPVVLSVLLLASPRPSNRYSYRWHVLEKSIFCLFLGWMSLNPPAWGGKFSARNVRRTYPAGLLARFLTRPGKISAIRRGVLLAKKPA
jgi:hypothetical protein